MFDSVVERTELPTIDRVLNQAGDGTEIIIKLGDGKVEVGGETTSGAGVDLAERGATFESNEPGKWLWFAPRRGEESG